MPAAWTDNTAYRAFRTVADNLDQPSTASSNTRYARYIGLVRSTYGAFESDCTSAQACTESTATGLTGAARESYLTSYSSQRATQAYNLALSLPGQMP